MVNWELADFKVLTLAILMKAGTSVERERLFCFGCTFLQTIQPVSRKFQEGVLPFLNQTLFDWDGLPLEGEVYFAGGFRLAGNDGVDQYTTDGCT